MAHEDIKKSPRIERARQRLDQAVQRLEAAFESGGSMNDLQQEIAAMKRENESLRQATKTVSEKLDGTIDRLRTVLEKEQAT